MSPTLAERIESIVQHKMFGPYELRVQIATAILAMESQRPYPPMFLPIIEGENGETLVLATSYPSAVDTAFKARSLTSALTSLIRNNQMFVQYGVQHEGTLFDMLKIWGFERVIVTDGEAFSYSFEID